MSTLTSFLCWLDALPARYWFLVGITLALVFVSALAAWFAPSRLARWNRPVVFATLLGLALFAYRWPIIFDNQQTSNPDESYMIAGALALQSDPLFWRSVDGATHGPLDEWPLAGLGAAGVRLDYTNVRIFAALLVWLTIVFTWRTLTAVFGDGLSRILVLPMVLFLATTRHWDFTQYTTEHVPVALLAAATYFLVTATLPVRGNSAGRLGLTGLLLGAVPFAKLQGAPLGLWLGAVGAAFVLTAREIPWPRRWRLTAWLVGGALAVPLAILAIVLGNGIWREFWEMYVENNLLYANAFPLEWRDAPALFREIAARAEIFPHFFQPLFGLLIAALVAHALLRDKSAARFALLSVGFLAVALYAVVVPNRPFTHYLQLTIAPLTLATAALFAPLVRRAELVRNPIALIRWPLLASIAIVGFVALTTTELLRDLGRWQADQLGHFAAHRGKLARSSVAGFLISTTRPDDAVAIWGWEPRYYVEAHRRPATREAETERQMFESPQRPYYRARYLADLVRSKPAVFADVVGPGTFFFTNRAEYGHETFPELARYVGTHYHFVGEIDSARIYLRNDRTF